MAVTDHLRRRPSLRAVDCYRPLNLDFQIYPGEEVHTYGNNVHIINFAGDFSVNEEARQIDNNIFDWEYPPPEGVGGAGPRPGR